MTPEEEARIRNQVRKGKRMEIPVAADMELLLSEIDRLRAAPVEAFGPALEEARDKFRQCWKDPEPHMGAVSFVLGLFSGIVLRRMKGEPDPDAATQSPDVAPPGAQS